MIRSARVLPLVFAAVAIAACKPKPAETAPEPAQTTPTVNADSARAADSLARAQAEAAARVEAENKRRADSVAAVNAAMTELRNTLAQVVFFDYDASEIRADQRAALDAKIPILRANPALRIRIAGHTDERGSDEYNMALGQRRAAAAKRYLVSQGIEGARIEIVSLGEERPAAQGSDDAAFSQNRRAEFEITAGGDNLQRGS